MYSYQLNEMDHLHFVSNIPLPEARHKIRIGTLSECNLSDLEKTLLTVDDVRIRKHCSHICSTLHTYVSQNGDNVVSKMNGFIFYTDERPLLEIRQSNVVPHIRGRYYFQVCHLLDDPEDQCISQMFPNINVPVEEEPCVSQNSDINGPVEEEDCVSQLFSDPGIEENIHVPVESPPVPWYCRAICCL